MPSSNRYSYVPVPDRLTCCGLPPPSSVNLTTAFRVPVAVGLKVTVIVQFAWAAMLEPQVLVSEKSPLLAPLRMIFLKFSCALPMLVSVTLWGGLLVPTD